MIATRMGARRASFRERPRLPARENCGAYEPNRSPASSAESVSSLPSFRAIFRSRRFRVHHFAERDGSAASGFADVGGFHKGDDLQCLFRLNRRSLSLEEFYDGGDPAVIAGTRRLIRVRSLRLFAGVL